MKSTSLVILSVCAVIFFGVYAWLATPVQTPTGIGLRFDWPDETANYFWASHFASAGNFVVSQPLNSIAANQIHPRSFNVRNDGALVPGTFLGLVILYGALAKILTVWALPYLTPIFGVIAAFMLFYCLRRIFDERIALLSAILLLFHPAWWYYSVTSLLPNVTFVALILISLFFILRKNQTALSDFALSGIFFGLAISIRPSEIIWLAILFGATFCFVRRQLSIGRAGLFIAAAVLLFLPSLYFQQQTFGNILTSGYSQLQNQPTASCPACQVIKAFVLPFGFNPQLIVHNFWDSFVKHIWWLTLVGLLGLISILMSSRAIKAEIFGYIFVCMAIFGWLVVYYGSWQFTDALTVNLNTLGISYVRYWLPLYVLSLPFIAIGVNWLAQFLPRRPQLVLIILLMLILGYCSARLVLWDKPDSILPVRQRIADYKRESLRVNEATEPNAVVVTVRKDKVLFPDRQVIHTFDALSVNQDLVGILPGLVAAAPTYYLALGPEPTTEFDNGLKLEFVENIGSEVLYRIK